MAKKISQLTQATQVKSDDVTVIVQDGETKKLPLNMMVTKQDIENKKVAGLAKLDEIEATYENDTYTPTIAVKNKSSVKVGEGDGVDYSANVMDGHVKSAILKGQTLVNVLSYVRSGGGAIYTKTDDLVTVESNGESSWSTVDLTLMQVKKNTKYIVIWDSVTISNEDYSPTTSFIGMRTKIDNVQISSSWVKEKNYVVATVTDDTDVILRIHATQGKVISNTTTIKGLKVFEYQEGMENWDIPYFEGIQSVKMPVLTTTGKNLFDGEIEEGVFDSNGNPSNYVGRTRSKNFIKVPKNTDLYISIGGASNASWTTIYFYNDKKEYTETINTKDANKTFNTGNNSYIKWKNNSPMSQITNIQIEQGSVATPYEPYKTNILSASEEVVLRGIGNVQDTLDCLTGEVTERIGEIVLDGSEGESWSIYTNSREKTVQFRFDMKSTAKGQSDYTKIISNNLPSVDIISTNDTEGVSIYSNGNIYISLLRTKATTLSDLNLYLQSNPITIQYELAEKSIKTVDLMPSGTHPSTTPYCWKNGHIQLSSSGLLPSLEYSVVTSRAGQISQNAAMIVKNDKRIFDLEILLAGGLVNTTYQALTLQNQVETGLSKVSLSSETEPDYLLYHMIMKLIEEKAYKLDDLAEKVSVFYLYEKLSDEQFEAIYAALYPFVEDEYDELPEEAENEVVM